MSYLGNGLYTGEENDIFLDECGCNCLCCGEEFTPGYVDWEGNDVYSQEFYVPPEKICKCEIVDAIKKELIYLDKFGYRLCEKLDAGELEVHHFSVWLDKTFEEIYELENTEELFAEWMNIAIQGG